jgi:hypothetical protein
MRLQPRKVGAFGASTFPGLIVLPDMLVSGAGKAGTAGDLVSAFSVGRPTRAYCQMEKQSFSVLTSFSRRTLRSARIPRPR